MAQKDSRDDRPEIQKITLDALQKLGGIANMVELRYQTMFKYSSKRLTKALINLRKKGSVTYIKYRQKGYHHGFWQIT